MSVGRQNTAGGVLSVVPSGRSLRFMVMKYNGPTVFGIRMQPDERRRVELAARRCGQARVSVWARRVLVDVAALLLEPGRDMREPRDRSEQQ